MRLGGPNSEAHGQPESDYTGNFSALLNEVEPILRPQGALTVRRVEQTLLDGNELLSGHSGAIRIDLSDVRYVEVGAGWRLGNAISHWSTFGPIHVDVPDIEIGSSEWFTIFTRSGLGLALSAFASRVARGGEDVKEEIGEAHPLATQVKSRNHVMISDLTVDPGLARLPRFATEFDAWAPLIGLPGFNREKRVVREALHLLGREALANVIDHAFKRPFADERPRLSYLTLNFVKQLRALKGLGDLSQYQETVEARNAEADSSLNGYVEMIVCDDGSGIAARHEQRAAIYEGPREDEDRALSRSFIAGASVKPITRDAVTEGKPGYGFTRIADGLRDRHAFAEIRSGRRQINFNAAAKDTGEGFEVQATELGYLPGTMLHVLFPVYGKDKEIDPGQMTLDVGTRREPAAA